MENGEFMGVWLKLASLFIDALGLFDPLQKKSDIFPLQIILMNLDCDTNPSEYYLSIDTLHR